MNIDKTLQTAQQQEATNQGQGVQQPLPLAFINGQAFTEHPEDLYIPPDALELILDAFEGPLDLLLYLIRKQKFDLVNLPVYEITKQYMLYVDMMKDLKLELAAEYLLMAAILAEIKSRLLLPKRPDAEEDEDDPRAELIRRLQEYELIKSAGQELDAVPRLERDVFGAQAQTSESVAPIKILPKVNLQDLVTSFQNVLQRASDEFTGFDCLFQASEGRAGVVVTFLAILELCKEQLVELVQSEPMANIHVKLHTGEPL